MRKKWLLLILAVLANSSYAKTKEYEGPPHYRVFEIQEIFDPIERGAYENILRLVDEQNRQKGTPTNYLEKAQYKSRTEFDTVDLIPVAQFTGGRDQYKAEINSDRISSVSGYSSVHTILTEKEQGLKEKGLFDKLTYSKLGNTKRFFFGKGNQANDIIMTGSDDFEQKVKDAQKAKNDSYVLEGTYERPGESFGSRDRNQLRLSLEEYESLKEKSSEEQLQFLAKRMSQKFSKEIKAKNGELYTKDQNGKDWKVLWTLEPVSEPQISYGTTKKYYKDDIFTNIFVYIPTKGKDDKTDSRGRILYTKDKNMIVEDKYKYGDVLTINEGFRKEYLKDKKEMTEEAFLKKWVLPFEEGGEFTRQMESMQKEIDKIQEKKEDMKKKQKEAEEKLESWKYSPEAPKDFRYDFVWETDPKKKKEYIDKLTTDKDKEFVKKYIEQEEVAKENDINLILNEKIPKKFGVYQGWKATPEERKWLDRVIANKEIRRKFLGKNVEFRGQGRIDGTVDLGEGHNELTIAEQFTGKYGTNIILGPKAILKNIAFVNISGGIGGNSKASLSGRTSLTLDIDPNIKNSEGRLVQHAFKDSDKNIVFRSTDSVLLSENGNDFSIELMASRIPENAIVDMGRKLRYTTQDFHDPGKSIEMKINIISDSIAHTVSEKEELSKEGNALLSVEVKDRLKKFKETENEVYASIKNAGKLNILQPTLTTTNKKTVFQVSDDDMEEKKKTELIGSIRKRKPEEVVERVSDFYLSPVRKKEAVKKIENILKSKEMKDLLEEIAELRKMQSSEEYQQFNVLEKRERISKLNPQETRQALSENRYKEETIQQKVNEMKEVLENIDEAALSKLATSYPKMSNIGDILQKVKYLKEEIKKNPTDNRKRQGLFSTFNGLLENLDKQALISEEMLDNKLAKYLESYRVDVQRDYLELKDILFYSVREEEALSELKNIVGQLQDKNIYSKLNKVAKSELSTYTNLPFDIDHTLIGESLYARGGFLSSRTVQKNFKGSTYTAYGIYEDNYGNGWKLGAMIGGSNTNHTETYSRTLRTVATESTIQGVSAYIGGYGNKAFTSQLEWITGVGLQYGRYSIKRELKNNYQSLESKGHSNVGGLNTYTGLVYSYPLPNDLILRGKGILSYSFVHQGKIKEKDGLNLDIDSKNYHYVDGELGISLSKTLFDDSKKSSLSAGVSGIFGLSGYKNEDMKAKIHGSSSEFNIQGDKTKKDAIKLSLDYNMQIDTGFNYGLEGTYITNKDQSDVKIGLKAGYRF